MALNQLSEAFGLFAGKPPSAHRRPPAAKSARRLSHSGRARTRVLGLPSAASLDHLGGAGEEGRRDRQAERVGGLEIQDQLEVRGLLDRKVARLGAL